MGKSAGLISLGIRQIHPTIDTDDRLDVGGFVTLSVTPSPCLDLHEARKCLIYIELQKPYPRQESNLHFKFRKPTFYPLNYGDEWGGKVRASLAGSNALRSPAKTKQAGALSHPGPGRSFPAFSGDELLQNT